MQKNLAFAAAAAVALVAAFIAVNALKTADPAPTPPTTATVAADVAPLPAARSAPLDPGHASPDVATMRAHIEGLGKAAQWSDAIEAELIAALRHEDQDVRGHAAWALGRMAPKTKAAIVSLIAAMSDAIWSVQHNASWALQRFDTADTEAPLLAALESGDCGRIVYAARTLLPRAPQHGAKIQAVVMGCFAGFRTDRRVAAIELLGGLPEPDQTVIAALIKELDQPDGKDQGDALKSIGDLGAKAIAALPSVVVAAASKDSHMRIAAAATLAQLGVATPEVVATLTKMLDDPKDKAGLAAAAALAHLGRFDAVAASLKSPSIRVRSNALAAVVSAGLLDEGRVKLVASAANDEAWEVRLAVASALQQRGPTPQSALAVATLERLTKDANDAVRDQAKASLVATALPPTADTTKLAPPPSGQAPSPGPTH